MSDETKKFPMYLNGKGFPNVFCVLGAIDPEVEEVFVDGKGYVYDGYVWIFKKKRPNDSEFPYFWYEKGSHLQFGKIRESIREEFKVENLKSGNILDAIRGTDPNQELYDKQALADMSAATSIYKPLIEPSDDFLKVLVKKTIINKNININRLKGRLGKDYSLSNMRSALSGPTKMSVPNFMKWCELLGVKYEMTIVDSGMDRIDPLPKPIHFNSETGEFNEVEE